MSRTNPAVRRPGIVRLTKQKAEHKISEVLDFEFHLCALVAAVRICRVPPGARPLKEEPDAVYLLQKEGHEPVAVSAPIHQLSLHLAGLREPVPLLNWPESWSVEVDGGKPEPATPSTLYDLMRAYREIPR